MKKTLAILLALTVVLALGVFAFADEISDIVSSDPTETEEPAASVEEPTEEDATEAPTEEAPAEETPAEETPAEEAPAEEAPAEETPAEETPAEEAPVEETPAEEAPAKEPVHISGADGYTAEELEMLHNVLGKRIQTGYSSWSYDKYGNFCLGSDYCNYELPAEIAEKYGTRDASLLPSIIIYESDGELDATETLRYDCYRWGENGEQIYVASKTFTVEIPAGGVAFYPIEVEVPDSDYEGYCYRGYDTARVAIIGASYGDLSIVFDD